MKTVGNNIVPLDGFAALITVIASAMTIHIYAKIGVPVSSSQSIVGAVIGIAFGKKLKDYINYKIILNIAIGWISTPLIAGILAIILFYLSKFRIVYHG